MMASRLFAFVLLVAIVHIQPVSAEIRQWRVMELEFTAKQNHVKPMGLQFMAAFIGPGERHYLVPGFWDGERSWKVRFAPTAPGDWIYVTLCNDSSDVGLHERRGSFYALPAGSENRLFTHGGFLRVSENRHYLTFSDGTPFFWLADTWWLCPSKLCPISGSSNPKYVSMYKTLVDARRAQAFTVIQMAFVTEDRKLFNPTQWTESTISFWREADQYITYANEAELLPVIGIGFHSDIDHVSLGNLKELWRYVIARYGSFAVTWLVLGEYNLNDPPERVQKVLPLGQFIKDTDPYKRAMSVHPSHYRRDQRQAWNQIWHDFIMIQCGHGVVPPADLYLNAYSREERKPVLEAECNYEGIRETKAEKVRLVAYRAIQAGSFGYTYGAHGLWYPTQSAEDRRFEEYGKPIPWWEALQLPGGYQMQHLRALYESLEWWKLEPSPALVETADDVPEELRILAKADKDKVFTFYFPKGIDPKFEVRLAGGYPGATYSARWFNPRTGDSLIVDKLQIPTAATLLPERPDAEDWVLILRKDQ
jgi:hypothetical protein